MIIKVGLASCGISSGGQLIFDQIAAKIKGSNQKITLQKTGCLGICYAEPLVEIIDDTSTSFLYRNVDSKRMEEIYSGHIIENEPLKDYLIDLNAIVSKQHRIVLRNCGKIDPESIESYIEVEGYNALKKVLSLMRPEDVIEEIQKSGLRGRGGAGFPTGLKWSFARKNPNTPKYLICNADEGDPGAFANRSVLEGDPHAVIEGMIIAGYAMGCSKGIVYCRAEYPLAIKRLEIALTQAKVRGFLGFNILEYGFDFEIEIFKGAGAFVCGEETALMESIEGFRGMPRLRPPYPAESGLFEKPTTINNVETLADIPWIIVNSGFAYSKIGLGKSRGTKAFSVAGKIKNGGLIEVPFGISLREVIFDICGGIRDDKKIKAVQLGGPSGGCLPASLIDTVLDYETLAETGAIVGSGGMIVVDENTCMVDLARFFLSFTQEESCGKCTFCRIGTKRMLEILNRICDGKGKIEDLENLSRLAETIKTSTLCALGGTAPNPVLTTLRYFRQEYEAHIIEKRCPAKVCKALIEYHIDDNCVGCGACQKQCPVDAISGVKRTSDLEEWKKEHKQFTIDNDICVRCGMCISTCRFDAIHVK